MTLLAKNDAVIKDVVVKWKSFLTQKVVGASIELGH